MKHSFIVAKFSPKLSTPWTTYNGAMASGLLQTAPFLALRVSGDDIEFGNEGKYSFLFLVSPYKPTGVDRESFCSLHSNVVEEFSSSQRMLMANPPLTDEMRPLYIHTFPALLEQPDSPRVKTCRHPNSTGPHTLNDISYEIFCKSVIDDRSHRKVLQESNQDKPTGGNDKAADDWETWSGYSGKIIPDHKLPWRAFEYLEFKDLPIREVPRIYEELLLYDQMTSDFLWNGVDRAVAWGRHARDEIQRSDLIHPNSMTVPKHMFSTSDPSSTLVDAEAHALHAMKVLVDGDPSPMATETQATWDWWPKSANYKCAPKAEPPITLGKLQVVAFDLYGTVLNREAAIHDALSSIGMSSRKLFSPNDSVEDFIEYQSIQFHQNPSMSYADICRKALDEYVKQAEMIVSDAMLEEALRRLLQPHFFEDVLPAMMSLRQQGYSLIALSSMDTETLETFVLPSLPEGFLFMLSSKTAAPLFIGNSAEYTPIVRQIKVHFPGIQNDQILFITAGQYRVIEPAHEIGIPAALLVRPGVKEARVNVDTAGFILDAENLTDLCMELKDVEALSIPAQLPVSITAGNKIPGRRVIDAYQLYRSLGEGAFSKVWEAIHLLTGASVAIKEEIPEDDEAQCLLPYEIQVYKLLERYQGIPRIHYAGMDGGAHIMIMDKLGVTLQQLRRFCRGKFSLKTTLMLAEQLLERIEFVHSRGLIIRDLKPENCAMGMGRLVNVVHLFDFGLAKLYVNPATGEHIKMREDRALFGPGTPRYASANVHFRRDQSRRDDLAALGHMLLYFLHGRLPWQGIYAPSEEAKVQRLGEMKIGSSMQELLARSPAEFKPYFDHIHSLAFQERPDYALLKGLFQERMEKEGWTYDWKFDWTDASLCDSGTLAPEEYHLDVGLVENKELDFIRYQLR